MASSLTDSGLTRIFLGARQEIRFRENPAKYGCFQHNSRQCVYAKPVGGQHFWLVASRKTVVCWAKKFEAQKPAGTRSNKRFDALQRPPKMVAKKTTLSHHCRSEPRQSDF
jgi:hypothetical protein